MFKDGAALVGKENIQQLLQCCDEDVSEDILMQ